MRRRSSPWRTRPILFMAALLAALSLASVTRASSAQALAPALQGTWQNFNAYPNIDQAWVFYGPQGQVLCTTEGQCTQQMGYWVDLWQKCYPSDCDWHWTVAQRMTDGWIRAVYKRSGGSGYTRSEAWLKTYPDATTGGSYLRVYVYNYYPDGRLAYISDERLTRTSYTVPYPPGIL